MNERIEQLALIAQKYVEDNKYDYDIVSYHHGFASRDKFAELIVREALTVWERMDNGNRVEGYLEMEDYPKALRKHTGLDKT